MITAMRIAAADEWTYWAHCMPLISSVQNGNSMMMPVVASASPNTTTDQKIIFCPALKRRAGGCVFEMKPPNSFSQRQSYRSGILSRTQVTIITRIPAMNGQANVLCASLAQCDQVENASGPISG